MFRGSVELPSTTEMQEIVLAEVKDVESRGLKYNTVKENFLCAKITLLDKISSEKSAENFVRRKSLSAENVVRRKSLSAENFVRRNNVR